MSEAALVKKQIAVIKNRGGWARKTHGGPQSRGWPDIIGCYRGYFLGIESKLPGRENTLTTNQAAALDAIKRGGGIARMYTTTQQVTKLLDTIDERRDRAERRHRTSTS